MSVAQNQFFFKATIHSYFQIWNNNKTLPTQSAKSLTAPTFFFDSSIIYVQSTILYRVNAT